MNTNNINSISIRMLLLAVLLFISGCNDDTIEEQPDLLFDFARIDQPTVDLGVPLVVESAVMNEPAKCEDCTTQTANTNDRSIRVQYRPDENSPWVDAQLKDQDGNITYELVIPVPEIPPGKKYLKSEGFSFAQPGFYRYLFVADRSDLVNERIETNNDTDSNDGTVGKGIESKFRLTVEVFDSRGEVKPNYDLSVPVTVRYLGRF